MQPVLSDEVRCVDDETLRTAWELEIERQPWLETFRLAVTVAADGDARSVAIDIDPSRSCGAARAALAPFVVAPAECDDAADAVLEKTLAWIRDSCVAPPAVAWTGDAAVTTGLGAAGRTAASALALRGGPEWQSGGRPALGIGARATFGLPVRVEDVRPYCDAATCATERWVTWGALEAVGRVAHRAEHGWVGAELGAGAVGLGGSGYLEDRVGWAPVADVRVAWGLAIGPELGFQVDLLRPAIAVAPEPRRPVEEFPALRLTVGVHGERP